MTGPRRSIWDTIRFPCCNAYPSIHPDTGVEVCYDCEAHRDNCECEECAPRPDYEGDDHLDECECAVCEVSRALDDDADMATSPDYWL